MLRNLDIEEVDSFLWVLLISIRQSRLDLVSSNGGIFTDRDCIQLIIVQNEKWWAVTSQLAVDAFEVLKHGFIFLVKDLAKNDRLKVSSFRSRSSILLLNGIQKLRLLVL